MSLFLQRTELRWINDDEPEAVAALSRRAFGAGEAMTAEFVQTFMDSEDHIPKVLVQGRKLLGYHFYVLQDGVIASYQLAVDIEQRRRGLASYMLQELIGNAPGLRRRYITADVPETAVIQQQLLRKNGFTCVRTLPGEPGQDQDRYLFRYDTRAPVETRNPVTDEETSQA
jgi:ribosomal protein S18 acetylase RimI-like enzyme